VIAFEREHISGFLLNYLLSNLLLAPIALSVMILFYIQTWLITQV